MLFFVTKLARHAAATARNDMDCGVLKQLKSLYGLFCPYQGFLMAMAVEPNLHCVILEVFGRNAACCDFAHDKLVKE